MRMDEAHEFPELTKACFEFFKKVAFGSAGIVISDQKKDMVYGRLLPRLRYLKLHDFDAYSHLIKINPAEEKKFINLMTNPTTGFFREHHHFKALARYLTHELSNKSRIRIWSAGCATGEEAYSIAIVVDEVVKEMNRKDIKILATDIDSDCLEVAEQGIYEFRKIAGLNSKDLKRFYRGVGSQEGYAKVIDRVRSLVIFRSLNLIEKWPMKGPFDIIFCRNVTIYFDRIITQAVLRKMDKLLKPDGLLILGHSEHLYDLQPKYTLVGKSIYRKLG